ncbi:FHA domain-containing serine/threonine-protein kinase [Lachnospiraceae bacterium 46-15]
MELDFGRLCLKCMEFSMGNGRCAKCGTKRGFGNGQFGALTPGVILHGTYLIGGMLGQGGFGITYLGLDLSRGVKVAVKEFMPANEGMRSPGKLEVHPVRRENFEYGLNRFYDEARTVHKYRGHPNIIHIYKLFRENGTAYYVMEYLDGMDMNRFLQKNGGKLDFSRTMQIVLPVMDALERVHQDYVIHRDISPDNIFVGKTVKLLDFGAARAAYGNQNRSLSVILKQGYAPVEQYSSRGRQGPWTDVYALSATMYRALTGKVIPDAPSRLKKDEIEDIRVLAPEMPFYSARAVMKGLAVKAQNRYSSIREFRCEVMGESFSGKGKRDFLPAVRIYGLKGIYAGNSLTLTDSLIMGRSAADCQLVFPEGTAGISRLHCGLFIDRNEQEVILQDMNSTYGTFLNGKRLVRGEAARIKNRDRVMVGYGQVFEIEF